MRLFSHDIAYHPSVQTSLSSSSLASTPILILKATFILNLCFILIIIFATNTILLSECALLPSEINEVDSFKESLLYAPITQLLPPPTRRPPTPSSSRPASVSLSHSHSPDQTHFKAKQCSQTWRTGGSSHSLSWILNMFRKCSKKYIRLKNIENYRKPIRVELR